jgi:hypothetical protein
MFEQEHTLDSSKNFKNESLEHKRNIEITIQNKLKMVAERVMPHNFALFHET